ncbi:hypothetical protein OG884_25675 [Streptosporangium sp. NBC_01755]|nr:hypothetical protein [Streptosporangium sp. NBC_01755]WSC98250.1 hypothetical protein OG884_25675 [Streptosporangium sp. NBC_01755]
MITLEDVRKGLDSHLGVTISTADVDHWHDVVIGHASTYGHTPPAELLTGLTPDIAALAELCRTHPHQRDLHVTAARLAGLIGAAHTDLGHDRDAREWLHTSGRIASLVLLDPAGFALPGPRFYGWALAGLAPRALRPRLARLVANGTILETEIMSLIPAVARYRRRLPDALVFGDDELRTLRTLRTRFLCLLAARSALHKSRTTAEGVTRLVPAARVEIVPRTGHALPMDRPDLVVEQILSFVSEEDD